MNYGRIRQYTLSLLMILLIISARFVSGEESGVEVFIPSTISRESQEFLRTVKPMTVKCTDREEWEAAFKQREKSYSDMTEKVLKLYPADLEKVEIAGFEHVLITPKTYDPVNDKRIIVFVHGGGHTFGSAESTLYACIGLAHFSKIKILSVEYPMAWEKPFPASRDVVVEVYRHLLKKYSPQRIGMFGSSAGGGCLMSAVMKIRDDGLPMPAALGLHSPWADLSKTGDTLTLNAGFDPILDYELNLEASAIVYADGKDLKDPEVSPIYADFEMGFPPSFILTGTRDLFQSTCARLQRKLTDAGIENRLFLHEGMWHAFEGTDLPEAVPVWKDLSLFFEEHLAR